MADRDAGATVRADELRRFADAALRAMGMPDDDAETASEQMVWADLRGQPGHGVSRLLQIAARSRAGGLALRVDWAPVSRYGSTTVMDARGGWGLIAGARGMRHAIEHARGSGIGATSVRNCDVTGAMGWYPSVAIADRMIGVAITNSVPQMPPWGGTTKIMGNQAFAIGCPATGAPLLFDTSSSALSIGKIKAANERGEPLPPGSALDASGAPTTDPQAALLGMVLPMGGHRGYGLALMWEVLTGVLAGGPFLTDVVGMDRLEEALGTSLFLLAIDPSAFMPYEAFVDRVDRLIVEIHASPPAAGVDRVRVPGEVKHEETERRLRDGVPIAPSEASRLRALGDELGVPWPAP
jgi:LDH2 family malate/lactate/ureidoglycolate dehydrogenase